MINEIKEIVQNYINNAKLCSLTVGTVVNGGIKISDKLIIPNELMRGNLIKYVLNGDKVRIIRNHGGKEFYIVEIIDKPFPVLGTSIILSLEGVSKEYKVEDVKL